MGKSMVYSMKMIVNMGVTYKQSCEQQQICKKSSCIILYKGDGCVFCDAAWEILDSIVSEFKIPSDYIEKVDVGVLNDTESQSFNQMGLPAIEICDEIIFGLPDIDMLRSAVVNAILKGCFSEHG
jgi:glutaredoxin